MVRIILIIDHNAPFTTALVISEYSGSSKPCPAAGVWRQPAPAPPGLPVCFGLCHVFVRFCFRGISYSFYATAQTHHPGSVLGLTRTFTALRLHHATRHT